MKIAVSSKSFYPILGGSIVFGAMLAKAFVQAGHEVKFITRTEGTEDDNFSFPVIRKPGFKQMTALADWADVLMQVDASWRDVFPFLLKGVPWFPTIHRGKVPYSDLDLKGKLLLSLEALGYQIGNAIGVADYVISSWNVKTPSIPNPYDESCFYTASGERDIDILYVGRLQTDKGIFVLLDAIKRLTESGERKISKVAFVGKGVQPEDILQEATSIAGVEVLLPGMLPPQKVADWMRRSKVLAFPTTPAWLEASPLTPLEALACGCRIVASDIGGTRENIGPRGILVKAGDAANLSDGLAIALGGIDRDQPQDVQNFLRNRRLSQVASLYLDRFQDALIKSNSSAAY